jgi:hypothetical protein
VRLVDHVELGRLRQDRVEVRAPVRVVAEVELLRGVVGEHLVHPEHGRVVVGLIIRVEDRARLLRAHVGLHGAEHLTRAVHLVAMHDHASDDDRAHYPPACTATP